MRACVGLRLLSHVALEQWFFVAVTWSEVSQAQVMRAAFATFAGCVALAGRERIAAALRCSR
jgi:hypothetical protein